MSPVCTNTHKPLSAVETVHISQASSPTLSDLSAPYYPPNLPRERFKDYTSFMRFLPLMDASVYLKHSERLYSSSSRAGRAVSQPIRRTQDPHPRRALGSTARTNVPKGINAPHHKNKNSGKLQQHRDNRNHAKPANRNRERPARPLPPRMRNMVFPTFDMSRQPSFEHCTVGWGSQMDPARDGRGVRRG